MKNISQFKYCYIEEILPQKFTEQLLQKTKEEWELMEVVSKFYSGFTLHTAKFKKYVIEYEQ